MKGNELPMGERLSKLRKSQGLSQAEVAEALSISRQVVSRWETGETAPSAENRRKLSQLYHIPLEYLMEDGPEWTPPPTQWTLPSEPDPLPEPAAPTEERPADGKRNRTWKIIAVCALLALAVVSAALVYTLKQDQPGENKSTVSGVQVEAVESVPVIEFEVEGWE